jgi:hypothetical protein
MPCRLSAPTVVGLGPTAEGRSPRQRNPHRAVPRRGLHRRATEWRRWVTLSRVTGNLGTIRSCSFRRISLPIGSLLSVRSPGCITAVWGESACCSCAIGGYIHRCAWLPRRSGGYTFSNFVKGRHEKSFRKHCAPSQVGGPQLINYFGPAITESAGIAPRTRQRVRPECGHALGGSPVRRQSAG